MIPFLRAASVLCLSLLPQAALAHPHVFIDAGLRLDYDPSGRLAAVEVEWRYDAFYSLLILEDFGIRPAAGGLTPEDAAVLRGFDGDWDAGFDGGLYLGSEGRRIALAAPRDFSVSLQDGQLVSRHRRPLAQPLSGEAPLVIQVYDPEFYVDFTVPQPPVVRGRADCRAELRPGDSYAAADAYAAALRDALRRELSALEARDEEMVEVNIGAVGADEIRVGCGASG
ncbi:MAG: DUF1007 family protein [Paracoccus sp. (in: a-proteobacteria)]|uniref:DUF1007 family protein n=1 Tax=Paracoccus sp. TaxID=267 RepID=UPI00391DA530